MRDFNLKGLVSRPLSNFYTHSHANLLAIAMFEFYGFFIGELSLSTFELSICMGGGRGYHSLPPIHTITLRYEMLK